jgi:mannitol-1-/sugar-/sorbitol-6-/2-deoxyglucose-6-phosphatase
MNKDPRIQAIIFDMDGLLIDSEPLWHQAMVDIIALAGLDFGLKEFREVQGMRIDLIVDYWYEKQPWTGYTTEELTELILDRTVALIKERGKARPGAQNTINFFRERGIPLAVASSSPCRIIKTNIKSLGLVDCFDAICSAEDERYGKPHPAVYMSAAEQLGVHRHNCLVFEDSVLGVLAAKAAEMTCICVPDGDVATDKRLGIADFVLGSLAEFDEEMWQILQV